MAAGNGATGSGQLQLARIRGKPSRTPPHSASCMAKKRKSFLALDLSPKSGDAAGPIGFAGIDGHGSANPNSKPPIKAFIPSPNHSSRNGAKIKMIVLHCTETNAQNTLAEFKNPNGRQVSAHYVIDVNGDIYQMVEDSERANHARGANQNSIGIEHVRGADQPIADAQAAASARLISWLLAEYEIPRSEIYGHDFAPGYDRSGGGTTCPDKLFGDRHTQQAVANWVAHHIV
jgi:N-acetyl-anhydromuramyl-L-alanine amidase AmpD